MATLIYIHIPKAAGTTMKSIIERQYPPKRTFEIRGKQPAASISKLRVLPADRARQLELVEGHMAYGIHAFLPQPAQYFTMLRHPVDRVVSYYHFTRRRPRHYLHQQVQNLSLRAFIESDLTVEIDNGQTRMLAAEQGAVDKSIGFGSCSADMLILAKERIDTQFALVGISERFDQTLLALRHIFGWTNLFYKPVNARVQDKPPLDPEIRQKIAQINALDIDLYDYAKAKLDSAIKAIGPQFEQDLTRFQYSNHRFGALNSSVMSTVTSFRRKLSI